MKTLNRIVPDILRSWWPLAPALALIICLTGCLVIPLHRNSGYARTNIERHTPGRFTPRQSTREEIILALGEPDAVSSDERQLAYRSEHIVALWLLVLGGGYSADVYSGTVLKNNFCVFEFDPQGRFLAARPSGQCGIVEGTREPSLKPPESALAHFRSAPPTLAGESVRFDHPKSFWLPDVDGYRPKGATFLIGRPGHLLCTDSSLAFVTASQFANTKPDLDLPFTSLAEARLDKYVLSRRLVVRLKTGEVHSFEIARPHGVFQDKQAMQAVCDFVRSKIGSTASEL